MFSLFKNATIYFLYKKFKSQILFITFFSILLYLLNSIINDFINIYQYSNTHQLLLLIIKWLINILSLIFIIYKLKNIPIKKIENLDLKENKKIFRDRTQIILDKYSDNLDKEN